MRETPKKMTPWFATPCLSVWQSVARVSSVVVGSSLALGEASLPHGPWSGREDRPVARGSGPESRAPKPPPP